MAYAVMLTHEDGRVQYAGKDSWSVTDTPIYLMPTIQSAKGKARHWIKISRSNGHSMRLKSVKIKPVLEVVLDTAEEVFTP